MRWKLIIITSLIAALINTSGCIALASWTNGLINPLAIQHFPFAAIYILPLVIITLVGVFVYRHTARRRKLQSMVSVILSLILIVAALLVAQEFLVRDPGREVQIASPPQT